MKYILHIALILFTIGNLPAQNESNKTKVIIKQADRLYRDDRVSDAQVLQGNVIFEHDGALMYCDSALIFQENNSLEAYGSIKVNQGDTITITGDSLFYLGDEKLAKLRGNIFFKEKDLKLTTNILNYDLNSGIANYYNGGTIVSTENNNKLSSQKGSYNSNTESLFLRIASG